MDTIEKGIYLGLLIELFVFLTLTVFFITNIIGHHRKKKRAYEQKLSEEIAVIEKERERIGSDIHDTFSSTLAALKLRVECIETADERSANIRDNAVNILQEVMERMRQVSHHMIPATLKEKGLVPALSELVQLLTATGAMYIDFKTCSQQYRLGKEKELHIFRAVQEILYNALKHSGAERIEASISKKDKIILLSIKDNGRGFSKKEVIKSNKGTGLRNVLSRIEIVKGKVFLETAKGKGVHFLIEIPVAHEYYPD